MLYPAPLSKDHKILEQEFCSGYIDSFGKWNTGFYCPQMESTTAVYCCGTPTFKYCCTMRLDGDDEPGEHARFFFRTPVMVGIIAGITLVLLFITIASCYFCSCCFVYKKRRAHLTGGLYRMQCSSTASGLMYSPSSASNHGSLVTTPLDSDGWNPQGQLFSTSTGATNCQNQIVNPNGPRAFLPLQNGYPHHYPTATSIATLRNQRMQPRFASNNNNNNINGQHNLPPPVFYPPSHLATTITSGTPSPRASSISCSGFPTRSPSSLLNGDVPRFTTLSSLSPYRPQNQYHTQPRLNNYANRRTLETMGGGSRPSYLTTFGNPHNVIAGQQQQRRPHSAITSPLGNGNGPPFGFCTLPRQQARQPGGLNIATRPALTEGREEDAVTSSAATTNVNGPTIAVQAPSESQASGEDTRPDTESTTMLMNRSNIQRLASCLSSSDSMHQALNASVL